MQFLCYLNLLIDNILIIVFKANDVIFNSKEMKINKPNLLSTLIVVTSKHYHLIYHLFLLYLLSLALKRINK